MENFDNILLTFDPITLAEMDGVALMNRTDTKFVFNKFQLAEILEEVAKDYRILEVNGLRQNRYKTLYYDTVDLDFYRLHQNGKKNRYKVRSRKYVDSDLCFLEVKFKNNKGRTIKRRVRKDDFELDLSSDSNNFIETVAKKPMDLRPTLWNTFSRITLVNRNEPERLTIDLGLSFEMDEETTKMKNLVIAELKQERVSRNSPFAAALKKRLIRPGSISKYCLGVALLKENAKRNAFKAKILKIEKVEHGSAA